MSESIMDELVKVSYDPENSETGGGHNQKGVDFQRYWTILRMLELESQGVDDFLILVEAIQDVAEIDSESNPKNIKLYQVKKKDRNEWSWSQLTKIPKKGIKDEDQFPSSPLGKLYSSVIAIKEMEVEGSFISNSGCALKLESGDDASTAVSTTLSEINKDHKKLLLESMASLSDSDKAEYYSKKIHIKKAPINIDGMKEHMVGHMFEFLTKRSPRHVNQANSFLDALNAFIAPLGRNTDTCDNFLELRKRHGFSKKQLADAFSSLEKVPDILEILDLWLNKLEGNNYGFMEVTAIKISATSFYQRQVGGSFLESDEELICACNDFISKNKPGNEIAEYLSSAHNALSVKFPNLKKADIESQLLLRAINSCVNPT